MQVFFQKDWFHQTNALTIIGEESPDTDGKYYTTNFIDCSNFSQLNNYNTQSDGAFYVYLYDDSKHLIQRTWLARITDNSNTPKQLSLLHCRFLKLRTGNEISEFTSYKNISFTKKDPLLVKTNFKDCNIYGVAHRGLWTQNAIIYRTINSNTFVDITAGRALANTAAPTEEDFALGIPEGSAIGYKTAAINGFRYAECDIGFAGCNTTISEDDLIEDDNNNIELARKRIQTERIQNNQITPVIIHDSYINRLARNTDGTIIWASENERPEITQSNWSTYWNVAETAGKIFIEDISLEEANAYDWGIYVSDKYAGMNLLTFEEFLPLCKQINLTPFVELKTPAYGATAVLTYPLFEYLVKIAKRYNMLDQVYWISFNPIYLGYILKAYEKAKIGFIYDDRTNGVPGCIEGLKKIIKTFKTDLDEVTMNTNISVEDITDTELYSFINDCKTRDGLMLSLNISWLIPNKVPNITLLDQIGELGIPLNLWTADDYNGSLVSAIAPYANSITTNALLPEKLIYNKMFF